jgi:drug/metabolite transporter (DMT)-like permease
MIMLSALFRSLYIFRLSKTASAYSVLHLQFARALFSSIIFAGWFLVDVALIAPQDALFGSELAEALAPLWSGWSSSPETWWLLAYNGIATGTLSVVLQQHGQRVVSASEANVIISMQIVFAVVFGCVLLGEVLVLKEVIGASLLCSVAIWVPRGQ